MSKTIAKVNGVELNEVEFRQSVEYLLTEYDTGVPTEEIEQKALDLIINDELIFQDYKAQKGLTNSKEIIDFLTENGFWSDDELKELSEVQRKHGNDAHELFVKSSLLEYYFENDIIPTIDVPEHEVEKEYLDNYDELFVDESYYLKQIFVDQEEENARELIDEALAALKAGTAFDELASKYTKNETFIDLGYFEKGELESQFEEIVDQLEKGEFSQVVASNDGFHIFLVVEKQPRRRMEKDEAMEYVERWLVEEYAENFLIEKEKELREKAVIEIIE